MSLCLFENTYSNLSICVASLEDGDKLSESEEKFAEMMVDLCETYLSLWNDRLDQKEGL